MIAHDVLRCNIDKIMEARVDIEALTMKLYKYGVLTHYEYELVFDGRTNMSTRDRATGIINSVMKATRCSGEAFDKFLQSLLECGEVQLQDTLLQYYSMLLRLYIIALPTYYHSTGMFGHPA